MLRASPSSPEQFDAPSALKVQTPEFLEATKAIDEALGLTKEDAERIALRSHLALKAAIVIEDDFFEGKTTMKHERAELDLLSLEFRTGYFEKQVPDFTRLLMLREGGKHVTDPDAVAERIEASARRGDIRKTLWRQDTLPAWN